MHTHRDEEKKEKGKQKGKGTTLLAVLCKKCKQAHPGCEYCCADCEDKCNSSQKCSWPEDQQR